MDNSKKAKDIISNNIGKFRMDNSILSYLFENYTATVELISKMAEEGTNYKPV